MARIAIDTVFFNMSYSGITRVWETLLDKLKDGWNTKIEIILLIRGKAIPINMDKTEFYKKYKIIHIPEFRYETMLNDIDILNNICKENQINWFISTYYTYCTLIPNILMIHDMIPEIFNFPMNNMWQQKKIAIQNASRFIVVSNTSKNDLIKYYPYLETEKYNLDVILSGVLPMKNPNELFKLELETPFSFSTSSKFISNNSNSNSDASLKDYELLYSLGLRYKGFIMTISTNSENYKNQKLINDFINKYIQLLKKLLSNNVVMLVINKSIPAGKIYKSDGVIMLSNISDNILHILYRNTCCFINPSLYEGFGLPTLEAMSYCLPVIALDLPVYKELFPSAINIIENDIDDLWDKLQIVISGGKKIEKRTANGYLHSIYYSVENQIKKFRNYFEKLEPSLVTSLEPSLVTSLEPSLAQNNIGFINLIIQSYNESFTERRAELEYCILSNLENPYVRWIHDFCGSNSNLPETITKHPKYILADIESNSNSSSNNSIKITNQWLTYAKAIEYSNQELIIKKYGVYWGIINCDIFLDKDSNWLLCRGLLNRDIVLAQSRYEFKGVENPVEMDSNFAKLLHAHTQDGWFYKAPRPELNKQHFTFEIGLLGCDNAIAHRFNHFTNTLHTNTYDSNNYITLPRIMNMPTTWRLFHYDIARGKDSSNFQEKHKNQTNKPINSHPERMGQYLLPNYNTLLASSSDGNIDLMSILKQFGGISNEEKYKIICDVFTSRIKIYNQ